MNDLWCVLGLVLALLMLAGGLACAALCRKAMAEQFLSAQVNHRSSHINPTSRGGGVAMFVPFLVLCLPTLLWAGYGLFSGPVLLVCLTGLALLLGLADDQGKLSVAGKFSGQLALAVSLSFVMGGIEYLPVPFIGQVALGSFGFVLSVLWIVAFINVYNFMDGLNGIAGGAALIAVLAMINMGVLGGRSDLVIISALLGGVLFGFFRYNYPAGRIFMGDSGSHAIGFLLAGLALLGTRGISPGAVEEVLQIDFIFLPVLFLPFIADVAVTLLSRFVRRQPLHQAHKEHIYQRLHQRGMSHGRVSAIYMGFCLVGAVVAWMTGFATEQMKWLGPFSYLCFMAAWVLAMLGSKKTT